ncbi:hypothetical protein [Paenibacillus terrae]|uniref:Uncharacterized protein n=1 Tax=Paenibacillus terrae TaxID=159743 RepID=A0A0D7WX78_9BACL|nr:hypothetical protein [Paenibacillus terrae]KJD43765.1 hypothetical protein QD47_20670 [Paenibacillus terrae]
MLKINQRYKYWELWYDEEGERQCAGTHWSEEWTDIEKLNAMEESDIVELITENQEFAKTYRGEKVTKQSIKPAVREIKSLIDCINLSFVLKKLTEEQKGIYIVMNDYLKIKELSQSHIPDQIFFDDFEHQLRLLFKSMQAKLKTSIEKYNLS